MDLIDYQRAAARTMNPALETPDQLLDAAAGLAEEAGEVLATVRKHRFQQHPLEREQLARELGDALWCLAGTATAAGISLGEVADLNLAKLHSRYPDGFSSAASRARADERAPP